MRKEDLEVQVNTVKEVQPADFLGLDKACGASNLTYNTVCIIYLIFSDITDFKIQKQCF
jgi:hypothetical protein